MRDFDLDEVSLKPKGQKLVVGILVAVAILGFATAVVLLTRPQPSDPLRLVVALRGSVAESFDQQLVAGFVDGLDEYGLTGVVVPAPTDTGDASLRGLATQKQAAHALLLDLDVERERDGLTDDAALYRAELTVRLVPEDPGQQAHSSSMNFAFERRSALEVATMVEDSWQRMLLPDVIGWLYDSPALEPALAEDRPLEELEATSVLRERRDAYEARAGRVQGFESFCAAEADEVASMAESGSHPVQCAGDPCGGWSVVGVDAQGQRAFVQDASRRLFVSVPWGGPAWSEPPEALQALDLGGAPADTPAALFRTGNILGVAEATPDGRFASVAAFTARDALAIVNVDLGTAAWRSVTVLDPGLRATRWLPSPDGTRALAWVRQRRRGGAEGWQILDGIERVDLPFTGVAAWLADGERVAGELPDGSLGWARASDGGEAVLEGSTALPGRLTHLLGQDAEGLWVAWEDWDGCELGAVALDAAGEAIADAPGSASEVADAPAEPGAPPEDAADSYPAVRSRTRLPDCLDSPTRLPDGRLVGIAYTTSEGDEPGDPEVVVLDPASGALTPLTSGAWIEELPAVSADGRRVVFNRRLTPWPSEYDLEIYRRVVCWTDVPPP